MPTRLTTCCAPSTAPATLASSETEANQGTICPTCPIGRRLLASAGRRTATRTTCPCAANLLTMYSPRKPEPPNTVATLRVAIRTCSFLDHACESLAERGTPLNVSSGTAGCFAWCGTRACRAARHARVPGDPIRRRAVSRDPQLTRPPRPGRSPPPPPPHSRGGCP